MRRFTLAAALPVSFVCAASFTLAAADDGAGSTATTTPSVSTIDDGHGAFASGTYHNLFVELLGKTQAESDAKVQSAFDQLFHGDPHTQCLFIPAGQNANGPLAYIPDIQHTDVRSEGMSYGMMIAVQLNHKQEFDALWNWSMSYMYHGDPTHPCFGFFSWEMNYDGTAISEFPAPDGEEYYAMALLFASNRWGNGTGIYDYKAQAHRLLHDMVHRAPITGSLSGAGRKIVSPRLPANPYELGTVIVLPGASVESAAAPTTATTGPNRIGFGRGPRTVTIGKEVNDTACMILFSPAVRNDDADDNTDPSYHLPAFYELWARWGPAEDRDFWLRAARASRDLFVKAAHPQTGLIPNRTHFDGTPLRIGGQFREDAWRCAMNASVDWSWFAKDPRQQELADRLQTFFESKGMEAYDDNWSLDGTSARSRHSPGLMATNAAASLAATDAPRRTAFVQALWNADVPSSLAFRYYDGLLYMMCLMHCSGDFRAIMPGQL